MSPPSRSATLSIRLIWPFVRVWSAEGKEIITPEGITIADFGNPEMRVEHRVVMETLERAVARHDDVTLGLRAGKQVEHGDFDVLEYAARSAPNFGEALQVMGRYMRLMHEAAELTVAIEGNLAVCRHYMTDGVPQPPAANDFVIATSLAFSRRNVSVYESPVEVWLAHEEPSYAAEYERYFETKVRFGAPCNAILIQKARLDVPMLRASAELSTAFELQARRVLEKLQDRDTISGRVRRDVASQIHTGPVTMQKTAQRLAMGVATLRRKLEAERTTFTGIVDDLRRDLAKRHLARSGPTVSEVAFLLGFSDVRAFGRAFRRWTGQSPTEYRSGQGE
jgi:AraC-like DNA-binding protein